MMPAVSRAMPIMTTGVCAAIAGCGEPPAEPFVQDVPGTTAVFDMIPIDMDGGTFWMQETEVTWDQFDAFVYEDPGGDTDAITRPTQPYVAVDRGYGHSGYPALSMSARAAQSYVDWLSMKTGRAYSLPTIAQWQTACGTEGGAWHRENAKRQSHTVASMEPNEFGLFDMRGNVAEWATGSDGPVIIGGSFLDGPDEVGPENVQLPTPAWNDSDPQIPRSPWWLADAPFVGMRVVCKEKVP